MSSTTRNLSFRARLMVSFLLIVILSLTASLLIYNIASDVVRLETITLKNVMLRELAREFNEEINGARAICLNSYSQRNVQKAMRQDYAEGVIELPTIYAAYTEMSSLSQGNFSDLFLYFKNSGRIISARNTSVDVQLYLDVNYTNLGLSKEILDDLFLSPYNIHIIDSSVLVFQTLPGIRPQDPNCIAVCLLQADALNRFVSGIMQADGDLAILNSEGLCLFSTITDVPNLSDISTDGNYTILSRNSGDSIVQAYQPESTSLIYVWLSPSEVFWDNLVSLRKSCALIAILFSVLGLLVSLILSHRNYRPIGNLFEAVSAKSGISPAGARTNEIAYIRHVLISALDEKQRHSKTIREGFLGRALQGNFSTDADIVSAFSEIGIQLLSDCFIVYSLRLESAGSISESEIEKAIENAFYEENEGVQLYGILACHRYGQYSYVLNLMNDAQFDAEKMGERAIRLLMEESGLSFTISSGDVLSGWNGLADSYAQSIEAMNGRAITGPGAYLPFAVPERTFRYSLSRRSLIEMDVISFIKTASPEPGEILAKMKQEACAGEILLPAEFACYAYDLCEILKNALSHLSIDADVVSDLSAHDNLPEFDEAYISALHAQREGYSLSRQEKDDESESRLCENVVAYIRAHYADPGLCSESIGMHFGLSGPYLSKRFKNHTGQSLTACITFERVKNVKSLLFESDEGLDAIAAKTGFLDSSALIRVFKKCEGITPGAYKKLYEK